MRSIMTLSVSTQTKQRVDKIAQQQAVNRSQIVQEALADYFIKNQFQQIRQRLLNRAQQQKVFTDEDVFQRIS